VLDFHYKVVQLNNLSWRDYLNSTNPLAVALMARMQIAPNDRWRVKATCLRLLAGLPLSAAQRRMLAAFVSIYLPLDTQETELFQAELDTWQEETKETVVELMTEWEVKGLEQGRIEGRIEGRTEERQELILRQLTRKVGPLPEAVQSRVVALPPDVLLDLSEALLDFSSLNDLTDWLKRSNV
jgi:predicted transposase YdaD